MAQTQLDRVYVQAIDGAGDGINSLSIGTKSLTTRVNIGGLGTDSNSIQINGAGTTITGPVVMGIVTAANTTITNASITNLGVTANASMTNVSIHTLSVVGQTTLANVGVAGQTTLQNTSVNGTLRVDGQTTLINVSATSLTASSLTILNNVSVGGNVSIGSLYVSSNLVLPSGSNTVLANASINGTLRADGVTTLKEVTLQNASINLNTRMDGSLTVLGATEFYNTVASKGASNTFTVEGQTTLSNTSIQGLTVSGNTSLSNTVITGTTDINRTGSATTTIGNSGSMTVVNGNCSFSNVSTRALTVGPLWAGATTLGSASVTGTLGVTGATTLSGGATVTGTTTQLNSTTTTVGGTLGVTGATTLSGGATVTGNSKIGNWFMYGNSDAYSLGTTDLANQFALYQNGGETVLNANNTNSNGMINLKIGNTTRMGIQNTPANTITDPPGSYTGTNLASRFVSGYQSTGITTITGGFRFSTSLNVTYGKIGVNTFVDNGQMYKIVFTLRSPTSDTNVWIEAGNNGTFIDVGLIGTVYKTYTFYARPYRCEFLYIGVSGTASAQRTIEYTHFSVEPFYGTTSNNSTIMTGALTTNSINSNESAGLNIGSNIFTAAKSRGYDWQYHMSYSYDISWPTVTKVGDSGGSYSSSLNAYLMNIPAISTETPSFADRFNQPFELPPIGMRVKFSMQLSSTGTNTNLRFYHDKGTLVFTTPFLTTTPQSFEYEFTVITEDPRDYNIVMTSGQAYVFRLHRFSMEVYEDRYVGINVRPEVRSMYHNLTTGRTHIPRFEVGGRSRIGNWHLYNEESSFSLGTNPFPGKFALYQQGGETVLNANNESLNGAINFKIGNFTKMTLDAIGKVGIGKTNPLYTLDVSGQTRLGNPSDIGGLQVQGTTASNSPNSHDLILGERQYGRSLIIRTDPDLSVASTSAYDALSTAKTDFFHWGSTKSMVLRHNGFVGIGGITPGCPLDVTGNGTLTDLAAGKIWSSTGEQVSSATSNDFCIRGTGRVMATNGFHALSDRRIKKNIVDLNDTSALDTLRLLKPKTYNYIDNIDRSNETVYGYIAQDIKEVLPYATLLTEQYIPTIYSLCTFTSDRITVDTTKLNYDASGSLFTKLKLFTGKGKSEFVNILEVIDAHTIKVDKDLTEWGGQLDASGEIVSGDKIFVYGQEVNDVISLNKDAIWTVATAALQEVDRQLQAEKQKTAALETTLASCQETLASLVARVNALEQR